VSASHHARSLPKHAHPVHARTRRDGSSWRRNPGRVGGFTVGMAENAILTVALKTAMLRLGDKVGPGCSLNRLLFG